MLENAFLNEWTLEACMGVNIAQLLEARQRTPLTKIHHLTFATSCLLIPSPTITFSTILKGSLIIMTTIRIRIMIIIIL